MSYRYRFIKVPKKIADDVRNLSYDDLKEYYSEQNCHKNNLSHPQYDVEEESFAVWSMFQQEEIYDFALLPLLNSLLPKCEPFFTNANTNEMFEHYNIRMANEQVFLLAIDLLRKQVEEYFADLLKQKPECWQHHIQSKLEEWQPLSKTLELDDGKDHSKLNENHYPYDTNREKPTIVTSWLYEYSIFELVRKYKEFDWENYVLMIYGW